MKNLKVGDKHTAKDGTVLDVKTCNNIYDPCEKCYYRDKECGCINCLGVYFAKPDAIKPAPKPMAEKVTRDHRGFDYSDGIAIYPNGVDIGGDLMSIATAEKQASKFNKAIRRHANQTKRGWE